MRKPVLFFLAAALFGCQYDPFAHEYTSVKPDESAMIGEYALDERSREMLKNVYKVAAPPAAFMLRPDHTFTLTGIPSCWRIDSSGCSGKTENVSGRWKIGRDVQEWWVLDLSCDRIDGESASFGTGAHVRGDEPPYILHFTVADPDAGEALAFAKR